MGGTLLSAVARDGVSPTQLMHSIPTNSRNAGGDTAVGVLLVDGDSRAHLVTTSRVQRRQNDQVGLSLFLM